MFFLYERKILSALLAQEGHLRLVQEEQFIPAQEEQTASVQYVDISLHKFAEIDVMCSDIISCI